MADPDDADLKARPAAGMERLRGKFIAGLPARAEQLTVALAQENRGEHVRLVHQLAGAAASFGMEALAERARALELALTANAEK